MIKGWKDNKAHYCPCNGRCHTEEHPCSFDCIYHDNLIILEPGYKYHGHSIKHLNSEQVEQIKKKFTSC